MRFWFILGSVIAVWLLGAWSLMMTVGNIHDSYWKFIPIMNYGQACGVTVVGVLFSVIFGLCIGILKEV